MTIARVTVLLALLGVADPASADFLGVRLIEDEALNAEARAALADFGVERAETARVLRMYGVYDNIGGAEVQEVFNALVAMNSLSPFHTFFNHPLGTALPPQADLLPRHPALAFDTFFTVNRTSQSGEALLKLTGPGDFISKNTISGGASVTSAGFVQSIGVPETKLGEDMYGTLILQITLIGAPCEPGVDEIAVQLWPVLVGSWGVFGTDGGSFQFTGDRTCFALLDEDDPQFGFVDLGDLALLLAAWGSHDACEMADFNGDGVVNGIDLGALLSAWGDCFCCEHVFPK